MCTQQDKLSDEVHNCCPFCGGDGFTTYSDHGEPYQEQCQYCYEIAFPLAERVANLESLLEYSKANNEILNKNLDLKFKEVDLLREQIKNE